MGATDEAGEPPQGGRPSEQFNKMPGLEVTPMPPLADGSNDP